MSIKQSRTVVNVTRYGIPQVVFLLIYAALCVPVLVDASLAYISVQAPIALWLAVPQARRMIGAIVIGSNLTLLGASGRVPYLGISSISSTTLAVATAFSAAFALAIYIFHTRPNVRIPSGVPVSRKIHTISLIFACSLFAVRFSSGVPILLGNSARIDGVNTISPLLGLLSGSLAIASAFFYSGSGRTLTLLRIALALMVFGTASRLLLLVVAVGLVTSSDFVRYREWKLRNGSIALVGAIACAWLVSKIYDLRTDVSAQASDSKKTSGLSGVADLINEQLGSSLFLSARNGLSVSELLEARNISPPSGFILGGLQNSFRLGAMGGDPERWLTTALGFDVKAIGAVATPIWAGSFSDFGLVGMILAAFAFGLVVCIYSKHVPGVELWIGVAIVLSYYGSYIISAQFFAALVIISLAFWLSRELDRPRVHSSPVGGWVLNRRKPVIWD